MSAGLGMCGWELRCVKGGWKGWAGAQHAAACVEGSDHTAGGRGTQMAARAHEWGPGHVKWGPGAWAGSRIRRGKAWVGCRERLARR